MLFSGGPFQPLEQVEKWLILIVAQMYYVITCRKEYDCKRLQRLNWMLKWLRFPSGVACSRCYFIINKANDAP